MKQKILSFFVLLILVVILVEIARRTGAIVSDSWQSVGPAAISQFPMDLKGTYLGDFDNYDHTWGHHWPGWPWVISIFNSLFGFHAILIFCICILLNMSTGFLAYLKVKSSFHPVASFCLILSVLLMPDLNVSASFMRPENLVACLVMILFVIITNKSDTKSDSFLTLLVSLVLVFTHVLGPIILAGFMMASLLSDRKKFRRDVLSLKWSKLKSLGLGLLVGSGLLFAWFFTDDSRWNHFMQNIEAQRSSSHSFVFSAKLCFLDINGMVVLLLFGILALLYIHSVIFRSENSLKHYAVIPILCLFFSVLTHNPNRVHLAGVAPLIFVMIPTFMRKKPKLCLAFFVTVVVVFSSFHLKRIVTIVRRPNDDIRKQLRVFLSQHKTEKLRIIPPSLWETAAELKMRDVRLYTFPNVASLSYRLECEKVLWSNLKNGDIFIFDETSTAYASDYFHDDVLARLRIVDPKTVGSVLQEVEIRGLSQLKKYSVIQITNVAYIQQALKTN